MKKKVLIIIGLALSFLALTSIIYFLYPVRSHWSEIFRPAALEIIQFKNPYSIEKFFNPPWALIPIIPFAILPEKIGNALYASISLFGFAYAAYKMGARWYVLLIFMILPQTLYNGIQVNVDWLVAIGFTLPPQIGLFFILLKPQIGIFLALYWFIEAWKKDKIKMVSRTFGPVSIAFLLSFLLFGFYFEKGSFLLGYEGRTLLPMSIPFGLLLFITAFRLKQSGYSITCFPLLTPYFQPYSLPLAALGIIRYPILVIPFLIGILTTLFDQANWYMIERLFGLVP